MWRVVVACGLFALGAGALAAEPSVLGSRPLALPSGSTVYGRPPDATGAIRRQSEQSERRLRDPGATAQGPRVEPVEPPDQRLQPSRRGRLSDFDWRDRGLRGPRVVTSEPAADPGARAPTPGPGNARLADDRGAARTPNAERAPSYGWGDRRPEPPASDGRP